VIPRDELVIVAKAAAKEAIGEWMLTLGVDASDPQAIIAIQKDFAMLRALRESMELVRRKSITTAVGLLVAGLLAALVFVARGH
jgi:hypothetical protein